MLKVINDVTGKMSALDRFSQTRLVNPESVLEHTGWVCMCSYFITQELLSRGEIISMAEVLSKAVLHDIEEIVIGDISAPTKYANQGITNEIKALEHHAADSIFAELPHPIANLNLWAEAKQGKSGLIVHISDKLAVVYKAHQEIRLFSNLMMKANVTQLLPAVQALRPKIDGSGILNKDVLHDVINEAEEICQAMV